MAIGLSALRDLSLGGPEVLPRAAVDALARLDHEALRTAVAAAAARTLGRGHTYTAHTHGGAAAAADEEPPHQRADSPDHTLDAATAAAACVLVRCAREVVISPTSEPERAPSTSPLRQAVIDCGVDDEPLLTRLVPLLARHVAVVRATLRASSFDFAHVVDVAWRLDYVLRSSAEGNVHEPVYHVQLKVQPPQGAVRDVMFACSVEGLRDLVYRLQDATNAIEKIAHPLATNTAAAAIA